MKKLFTFFVLLAVVLSVMATPVYEVKPFYMSNGVILPDIKSWNAGEDTIGTAASPFAMGYFTNISVAGSSSYEIVTFDSTVTFNDSVAFKEVTVFTSASTFWSDALLSTFDSTVVFNDSVNFAEVVVFATTSNTSFKGVLACDSFVSINDSIHFANDAVFTRAIVSDSIKLGTLGTTFKTLEKRSDTVVIYWGDGDSSKIKDII